MTTIKTDADLQNIAEALKALAHPERLAILKLLCEAPKGKLIVKAIYNGLGLQQPVVSRHLSIMKNSGVLKRIREQSKIYYCLCEDKRKMESLLACFCNNADKEKQ